MEKKNHEWVKSMLDFPKNKTKTGFKDKTVETVQNFVRTAKTDF